MLLINPARRLKKRLKKPKDKFDQDLSTSVVYKRTQKSRPHMWQELPFGTTLYEKQPQIWF